MARKPTAKKSAAEQPTVLPRSLVVGVQTIDQSTGKAKNLPITDSSLLVFNKSIADVRTQPNVFEAIRLLRRISGDTSTAIASFVRMANTPLSFKVYDATHQLSDEGSLLIKGILTNLEVLNDYSMGFDERMGIRGLVDTLLAELLMTGAIGLELVLDKARLPFKLQPVSASKLKWKTGKTNTGKANVKIVPYQQAAGVEVELDVPTFFYAALDADPNVVYPKPMLEAAINTAVFAAEVVEDIRRVVKRSGHSRLVMKLITEELLKAAPPEIKMDSAKLGEWLEQTRTDLVTAVENLSPESALVLFDSIDATYLNSEIGASADYKPLVELVDGLEATALRTPPSVLGKRMGGSQNVSSTESLIFVKQAAGLHTPLAEVFSKAMTLALRLYGFDGYCKAEFASIDLRPESELEAFKSMQQQRVLELLSLGFLTDQEAAEQLGTGMRAPGAPPLSGTFFYGQKGPLDALGMTPESATSGDPGKRASAGNSPPSKAGGKSQ